MPPVIDIESRQKSRKYPRCRLTQEVGSSTTKIKRKFDDLVREGSVAGSKENVIRRRRLRLSYSYLLMPVDGLVQEVDDLRLIDWTGRILWSTEPGWKREPPSESRGTAGSSVLA
jgi:hypothetical protein